MPRSDKEDVKNDEARSEVPAKKAKIEEESDHESEGDFAEKLLEGMLKMSYIAGFEKISEPKFLRVESFACYSVYLICNCSTISSFFTLFTFLHCTH